MTWRESYHGGASRLGCAGDLAGPHAFPPSNLMKLQCEPEPAELVVNYHQILYAVGMSASKVSHTASSRNKKTNGPVSKVDPSRAWSSSAVGLRLFGCCSGCGASPAMPTKLRYPSRVRHQNNKE